MDLYWRFIATLRPSSRANPAFDVMVSLLDHRGPERELA